MTKYLIIFIETDSITSSVSGLKANPKTKIFLLFNEPVISYK